MVHRVNAAWDAGQRLGSQAANPVNSHKILNSSTPPSPKVRLNLPPALSYYAASTAIPAGAKILEIKQ